MKATETIIGDGGTGCIEGFGGLRFPIKDD